MKKSVSTTIVMVVGAVWLVAPLLLGLWPKTAAADRLTENLEPAFKTATIKQAEKDVSTVVALTDELQTVTVPFLADQLKVTPADVVAVIKKNFPATARLLSTEDNNGGTFSDDKPYLVHAGTYLDNVTKALKANQSNFQKASDIPASWLPTQMVPWLFFLLGLIMLLLGLVWRTGLIPLGVGGAVIGTLGVVVILVTLVLGLYDKTTALDDLTDNFRPVFTDKGDASIAEGAKYLKDVTAAQEELETKVVPALPGLLGISLDQTLGALQANSPVVYTALATKDKGNPDVSVLRGIIDRFAGIAKPVAEGIDDFKSTDAIPGFGLPGAITPWLLSVPGLLLAIAGFAYKRNE